MFKEFLAPHGNFIGFLPGHSIQFEQMLQIAFANGFTLFDGSIHQRLSKERLVAFVVAQPPVTPHIHHHVAFEPPPKIHGEPDHLRHGFRIFAIDVKDRDLEHFGNIAGVNAGFASSAGEVVKPIWLLTMMCIVPPTVYALS